MSTSALCYVAFLGTCLIVLKELNGVVIEPYMVGPLQFGYYVKRETNRNIQDEPFHVPQAQAYCRGEYASWDPKITTPPGL